MADATVGPMGRPINYIKDAALARLAEEPPQEMAHVRHKLRRWMVANGLTIEEMARVCCMSAKTLRAHLAGELHHKTYMPLHQAFAIEWATKGHVQAYEWLDDPYQAEKIRRSRMSHVRDFESKVKRLVLRSIGYGTPDGVLRNKARVLSRCFQVNWAEVKRRAWEDARKAAKWERADVSHLMLSRDDNGEE
jgi:hypothetical protein